MKFKHITSIILQKEGIFFHNVFFFINTIFPSLRATLYAERI